MSSCSSRAILVRSVSCILRRRPVSRARSASATRRAWVAETAVATASTNAAGVTRMTRNSTSDIAVPTEVKDVLEERSDALRSRRLKAQRQSERRPVQMHVIDEAIVVFVIHVQVAI